MRKKKSSTKTSKRRSNFPKTSTPASVLIDAHYERLGIVKRWDRKRLERLCGFLRVTEYEIASLIGVLHRDFGRLYPTGKLPLPAYLLLTILEKRYMSGFAPDVIHNLFDFYGRSKTT